MKRVLVTGGSGFVGTNLVEHYVTSGCDVRNIDIVPPRNPSHSEYWREIDICDFETLRRTVEEFVPDLIMHMAARTDLDGPSVDDYAANTDGVKNVINVACRLPELERVVFASSMLVCKLGYRPQSETDYCPTTAYGKSKVIGENHVRDLAAGHFPWTIVRPTSLWGPWFGVPYKNFFVAVSRRMYMHPRGRKIYRNYGFVLNSIYQLDKIARCSDSGLVNAKIFYLADYQPVELLEWARTISAGFGVPPPREIPVGILRGLAFAGDLLKKGGMRNPPLSTFRLDNLLTDAVFAMSQLEAIVGTCPYSMVRGVEITVDWMSQSASEAR